jgi:hypothetical protein
LIGGCSSLYDAGRVSIGNSLITYVENLNDEKSTFTFEDAMSFVGADLAVAA